MMIRKFSRPDVSEDLFAGEQSKHERKKKEKKANSHSFSPDISFFDLLLLL